MVIVHGAARREAFATAVERLQTTRGGKDRLRGDKCEQGQCDGLDETLHGFQSTLWCLLSAVTLITLTRMQNMDSISVLVNDLEDEMFIVVGGT